MDQIPQSVEPEPPIQAPPVDPNSYVEGYVPPPTSGDEMPPPGGGGSSKRLLIIGLAGFIVIAIIIGLILFFINKGTQPKPIMLVYWGLWENEAVMQTVIDEYQQSHPNVTIQYSDQSPIEYRQRLQAAIARGEGPDIFRFHNTWVPMMVNDLARAPASIVSPDEFKKTYYPVMANDLTIQGSIVGVPLMVDGLMLYYNKTLLSEAGVAVPSTWEEFESSAQRLTVKDENGAIILSGAAIGTADNIEHFSDILGLTLQQNNADFSDLKGPAAIQTLTYYTLFALPPNNIWDMNQDNSIVAFAGGRVAMIFAPSWQVFTLQAMNPDLNFGAAPVPQLTGAAPVSWASYWAEGVSSKSQNPQAAFEFLQYLSSKDTVTKLYTEVSKTRAFGSAYARTDLAPELSTHEFLGPIVQQAPNMRSWYLASRTRDNGINDEIIGYFRNAVNAVYQGSSPLGALETASKGVTDVLTNYGL